MATLAQQIEAARAAHATRDTVEAELRAALSARDAEIDQARANMAILAQQIEAARAAHATRDAVEAELRAALSAKDLEIERARTNTHLQETQMAELTNKLSVATAEFEKISDSLPHRIFHPLRAMRRRQQ
jgi:hypothetical protein